MNATVEYIMTLYIKMQALDKYNKDHADWDKLTDNQKIFKHKVVERLTEVVTELDKALKENPTVLREHAQDAADMLTEENVKKIVDEAFTFNGFSFNKTSVENLVDSIMFGGI